MIPIDLARGMSHGLLKAAMTVSSAAPSRPTLTFAGRSTLQVRPDGGVVARIVTGLHDANRQDPVRLEFPILSLHPGLRQRGVAPDVWPTLSRA